jgi:hypothetical protein
MTDDRTFVLADSFDRVNRLRIDLTAPLPLGHKNAVRRGLQLRDANPNMSYAAIAMVMSAYHGIHRSASWWSRELRRAGAEARPRGVPRNGAS